MTNITAPATATLTHHARQRCAQMNVSTKRIKHALRPEHIVSTYPDPDLHNVHVHSRLEPNLVIVTGQTHDVVVTVLWNTDIPYTRPTHGKDPGPSTCP